MKAIYMSGYCDQIWTRLRNVVLTCFNVLSACTLSWTSSLTVDWFSAWWSLMFLWLVPLRSVSCTAAQLCTNLRYYIMLLCIPIHNTETLDLSAVFHIRTVAIFFCITPWRRFLFLAALLWYSLSLTVVGCQEFCSNDYQKFPFLKILSS